MRDAKPGTIFLDDYQPPAYLISRTKLDFELYEDHALVHSTLFMFRNPELAANSELVLHGQDLTLLSVKLDGVVLPDDAYQTGVQSLHRYLYALTGSVDDDQLYDLQQNELFSMTFLSFHDKNVGTNQEIQTLTEDQSGVPLLDIP